MVMIDVHIQIGICSYAMFAMYLASMSWAPGRQLNAFLLGFRLLRFFV
jgi:hypothetical protein